MTAKWGICACLALCLALSAGCRTPQPNLKPAKEEEKLTPPPQEVSRYSTTGYPEIAFDKPEDPGKKARDANLPGNGGMQRTGGSSGMGGGGH